MCRSMYTLPARSSGGGPGYVGVGVEGGTTFSAIVDRVQRERALVLLATSDLPITTISTRVGLSAPAGLTRAVRRWTGLSPTDYRRRQ